jgi:hypothetical protein
MANQIPEGFIRVPGRGTFRFEIDLPLAPPQADEAPAAAPPAAQQPAQQVAAEPQVPPAAAQVAQQPAPAQQPGAPAPQANAPAVVAPAAPAVAQQQPAAQQPQVVAQQVGEQPHEPEPEVEPEIEDEELQGRPFPWRLLALLLLLLLGVAAWRFWPRHDDGQSNTAPAPVPSASVASAPPPPPATMPRICGLVGTSCSSVAFTTFGTKDDAAAYAKRLGSSTVNVDCGKRGYAQLADGNVCGCECVTIGPDGKEVSRTTIK